MPLLLVPGRARELRRTARRRAPAYGDVRCFAMALTVQARTLAMVLVAVVAATAVAVAPAGARTSLSCARSGATIAANSQARVFRRGKVPSGETKGAPLYYGCSRRTGHIRRLNRQGGFGINRVTASTIRLAGHYVGYVETDVEAAGELPFATVVDVRSGHVTRNPQGSDLQNGQIGIVALVLTARGSEAWIARDCVRSETQPVACAQPVTTEYRVTISDAATGTGQFGERVVAHSAAIAPHSLALAANSHDIFWTEAGAARQAPIR